MNRKEIQLSGLIPTGGIRSEIRGERLWMTAPAQNFRLDRMIRPFRAFLQLPEAVRLPFSLEINCRMDAPSLFLLVGDGYLSFGDPMENRSIRDPLMPDPKKPRFFDNHVPIGQETVISVTYAEDYLLIIIDGEQRYFSPKEKYMKALTDPGDGGRLLPLRLACSGGADITISRLEITEYDPRELTQPPLSSEDNPATQPSVSRKEKAADLEACMQALSPDLRRRLLELDASLRGRKPLKIRRKIEGNHRGCKITYVSAHGFSYALQICGNVLSHFFWWYMVSNFTYEQKFLGRKNDWTAEMLERAYMASPEMAERLFGYYSPCVGCAGSCNARTRYALGDRKINACHGKMVMNMGHETIEDVDFLMDVLEAVVREKSPA